MSAQPEEVLAGVNLCPTDDENRQIAMQLDELDELITEFDRLYNLAVENGLTQIATEIAGDIRDGRRCRRFLASFATRPPRKEH